MTEIFFMTTKSYPMITKGEKDKDDIIQIK